MSETLILVDNNDDPKWINDTKLALNSAKIITFDFLVHRSLKNSNISHDLVENYFSEDDKSKIDNFAIELATTWYKHADLIKNLEYKELNIGNLLELELLDYFFSHLKRLFGVIRIIENEKPQKIICSSLGNLVDTICKKRDIEVTINAHEKQSGLHFDTIEVPLKIGNKIITLRISRQRFLYIKKISEFFLNLIFNFKPNMHNIKHEKSLLLLDFNPVNYSNLLTDLSHGRKNVLLLNQRRPAIWNLKSFKIIRNSKCKIIQLDDFTTNKDLARIKRDIDSSKNKLDSVWSHESILFNIFSFEGNSFWPSIKNNFQKIIETRMTELISRYSKLEKLFAEVEFDHILEWAHTGFEEKIAISLANKKNIPIILLQHGLYILNKNLEKYNGILPLLPSHGVKEAVWGEVMKEYLLDHGVSSDKIILTGSPRHDDFFKRGTKTSNEGTILIAASGFFHNNFNGTDTRSFDLLERFIREIFRISQKYPNKKIIVKLHPEQAYFNIKSLIHEIDPKVSIYQNENIMDLMVTCDSVISLNYSTAILDAMILNKAVLIILAEKQDFELEMPIMNKAVLSVSKLEELERIFDDFVSNQVLRTELINNGRKFVDKYLVNHGTSSEYITKILSKSSD